MTAALTAVLALLSGSALAQRPRFPTMVQANSPPPTGGVARPAAPVQPGFSTISPGGQLQATPGGGQPVYVVPPGGQVPQVQPGGTWSQPGQPGSTFVPPGTTYTPSPTYGPPGTAGPTYGPAPIVSPGPAATFDGRVLPPPSWDPYSTPGAAPPSLLPEDPYLQVPAYQFPSIGTMGGMTRFLQEIRADYTWLSGQGARAFSMHSMELTSTFAVPFLYSQQNPLLVTPGFAFHFLSGPRDPIADMPPRLYDAFLDLQWNPQVTPWFGGELGFRTGIYSDFQRWSSQALRFTGHGLAVLTFSPSIQMKAGVVYLDRVHVKLLPAGGLIWMPNNDVRFEVLFPNPRIARRLWCVGITEWWGYVRGEYGGGSWIVQRELGPVGQVEQVDYNDIRVALGVEFIRHGGMSGLFEVGLAFDRELRYRVGPPATYRPDNTVFLRAGVAF